MTEDDTNHTIGALIFVLVIMTVVLCLVTNTCSRLEGRFSQHMADVHGAKP